MLIALKKYIIVISSLLLTSAVFSAGDYRFVSSNDSAIRLRLLPMELIEMDRLLNRRYINSSSEEWYLGFTLIRYEPRIKGHPTSRASFEVLVGNPDNIRGIIKYGIMTMPGGEVKVEVFDTKKKLNKSLISLGLDPNIWSME